jgi:hypothetical protein
MPQDPTLYIVLIIAGAILMAFVVWRQGYFRVRKTSTGVELETGGPPQPPGNVTVLNNAEMRDAEFGDAVGVRTGPGGSVPSGDVNVANHGNFDRIKAGDFIGVDARSRDPAPKNLTKTEDASQRGKPKTS